MHQTRRIPIVELNDYLACKLCKGYFIDATTIIECLHTFCRSCIVRYLDKNKYCPVCDVQVHKTKPLLNIRPDKTLQDIVYKLVPRLFQNEMCRRREFYTSHSDARPSNLEQCGEASYQHILSPDETICLSLNYHDSIAPPRYLRCPAAVSVVHLQKLLRSKYDLTVVHRVDILHNQDCLNSYLTLMDIAYIYLWRRKGPLELTYRIYENTTKKQKPDTAPASVTLDDEEEKNKSNGEWKEVQLRISENGEMCITGVDDTMMLNEPVTNCDQKLVAPATNNGTQLKNVENTESPDLSKNKLIKKDLPALKYIGKESNQTSTNTSKKNSSLQGATLAPSTTSSNSIVSMTNTLTSTTVTLTTSTGSNITTACSNSTRRQIAGKHKIENNSELEPPPKQQKQTILNHSLGIHNLSNNHPLKRHSQVRKSTEVSTVPDSKHSTTITTSTPATTTSTNSITTNSSALKINNVAQTNNPTTVAQRYKSHVTSLPCYTPKTTYNPVINVPKVQASTSIRPTEQPKVAQTTHPVSNNKTVVKNKSNTPIGYKTLRDPPRTWNPQISRASLLKSPDPKFADSKNVRPAKFFKMRNNMPRYLGNPASGVKPLYQVHNSPEKEKNQVVKKPEKSEIKKHSIVKIDPKTLKPISEKAPESSNLSNQSDLKINTSSVPIFNPLKLQSSPKSERKSPKSPQSPKPKSSSPPNKRDKPNLNYTPPNPFIPNLASPTLSPNQFLYPGSPPGFPTYDPRIMAAYHSLLYGQRMPYPSSPLPGLSLDLNRTLAPTSQQFSPKGQASPTMAEKSPSPTPNNVSRSQEQPRIAKGNAVKRMSKESGKNEKSLQNAVEKLTQSRVKELNRTEDKHVKGVGDERRVDNGCSKEEIMSNKVIGSSNENSKVVCNHSEVKEVKKETTTQGSKDKNTSNKNVSNNNNSDSVSLVTDPKKK